MVITKCDAETVGALSGLGDPLHAPLIQFLQVILEQQRDWASDQVRRVCDGGTP